MALEIERKFLATSAVLPFCRSGTRLIQGYIYTDAHHTFGSDKRTIELS